MSLRDGDMRAEKVVVEGMINGGKIVWYEFSGAHFKGTLVIYRSQFTVFLSSL